MIGSTDIVWADMVLVMEYKHRQRILADFPGEMNEDGFLENIDDWSFSLSDLRWTRLTMRKWVRFQVSRFDGAGLHLWQYDMKRFSSQMPDADFGDDDDLAEQIGGEPDMEAFNGLYRPPVNHATIEPDPENDDEWKAKRIQVDDVCVRYTDEMEYLTVTVEGQLPASVIDSIANDLQEKLSRVENTECKLKWID